MPVDVELVLAVDASYSVNAVERGIQREGYVAAFADPVTARSLIKGAYGRIAVTYVEWGDDGDHDVVVPWTLIDTPQASFDFAAALDAAPTRNRGSTSISSALGFSAQLFAANAFAGDRQVIDISGDGPNTAGPHVARSRDAALLRGITINGLPLPGPSATTVNLSAYFRHCVIGGPGAFLFDVASWRDFDDTLRRKLILEVAGGGDQLWPIAARTEGDYDCLVGEKQQRDRYLKMLNENTRDPERWMPTEKMWPTPSE
ncbi:MAG: DUF1194 domain-containing protein [Paracoccaceae bacterium]